ncbi:SDR family NAD(P)-dependent oxidoreductase, partial [Klebsiella variicola]
KKGHAVYGFSRQIADSAHFKGLSVDVTDKEQINQAVSSVIEKEGRIDVLINNAGMGMVGSVEDTTKEDIHKLFDLNLVGPI